MNTSIRRLLSGLALLAGLTTGPQSQAQTMAPHAVTQAPFITGSAGASLNGAVVPNGSATLAWFEWGTDSTMTNTTATTNAGVGLGVVRVSLPVAGLMPRVTYHCRLVASNALGLVRGAEQWFTTGRNVAAWGFNSLGQTSLPGGLSNVVAVVGGWNHSLALKVDGRVVAWGDNSYGQANVPAGLSNVVAMAAGIDHNLVLKSDGRAVAWGDNYAGRTNVPAGLSNVVSVAAGAMHNLALKSDGRVVAWGDNGSGQTNVPAGLSNVVVVAAGFSHNLALTADGRVVEWGNNGSGLSGLSNVVAVAAGSGHSLALKSDGRVVAWGRNDSGQANVPVDLSNVVAVATGGMHSLALRSDGRVVAWGSNWDGQRNVPEELGTVTSIGCGASHNLVLGNLPPRATFSRSTGLANHDLVIPLSGMDPNNDFLAFRITTLPAVGMIFQYLPGGGRGAAINSPSTAVKDAAGRVIFVPATNAFGRPFTTFGFACHDGEAVSSEAIMEVEILGPPLAATQPATIFGAECAKLNGMVVANGLETTAWFEWGMDRTMTNTTATTNAGAGVGVVRVSIPLTNLVPQITFFCRLVVSNSLGVVRGAEHWFTTGKNVSAWGHTLNGQADIPAGLSNAVAVAGGGYHSLALRSDGRVVVWDYGQTNVPAGISNVIAISGAQNHGLALTSDGRVMNIYGQIPVPSELSNVGGVAGGGGNHGLALKKDGRVVAWGSNFYGSTDVPADLSNVVAVAAGIHHNLALKSDGRVVAWGYNSAGQATVPSALNDVVAVAAGGYFSLALKSDGRVVAWGSNYYGQTNVPAGLSNVVAVAAGLYHSLALKSDGHVGAWGLNTYRQAGGPDNLSNIVSVAAGDWHNLAIMDGRCRIMQQPKPLLILPEANAVFQVSVSSDNPVSYQWQCNGTNLIDAGKTIGATTAQLTLTNVSKNAAGDYRVLVTHPYGVVTSSVGLLRITPRAVFVVGTNAAPGATITLPVRLVSDNEENSIAFSVAYDTNLLSLVTATNGADALHATFTMDDSQVASGRVGLSLAQPASTAFTNGLYELALLTFNVAAISNTVATPLTFGDAPVTRATRTSTRVSLPTLYVAGGVTVQAPDSIALSSGSSLFRQLIRVTNPANAGGTVQGVRLWFHDLGVDSKGYAIRVYNATGTSNDVPYMDYTSPLAPGESVNLTVEYYIADRKTMPHPRIVVQFLGLQTFEVPEGTTLSVMFQLLGGTGVVEFNTLAGQTYYVQYAEDANGTGGWKTALPAINGTGGVVQWIDNGPPKTESAPSEAPSRFYRVLLVTPAP